MKKKEENPASIWCLHDSSTDPLRFMAAALRFTPMELRMLTMRPRFNTVLVRFKPVANGSVTTNSWPNRIGQLYCIRDESVWIGTNWGVSDTTDSPRMTTNTTTAPLGLISIPPTVELRFRPGPQSTTIRPKSFKRFKIVVALSGRFPNHQDSSQFTTVLLRLMPMSLRCY